MLALIMLFTCKIAREPIKSFDDEDCDSVQDSNDEFESSRENLQEYESTSDENDDCSNLKSNCSKSEDDFSNFKSDCSISKDDCSKTENDCSNLETGCSKIEDKCSNLKTDRSNLETDCSSLQSDDEDELYCSRLEKIDLNEFDEEEWIFNDEDFQKR